MRTLVPWRSRAKAPRTARLETDVADAASVLKRLADIGIDLDRVAQQLEDEGIEKFNEPFDTLLEALGRMSPHPARESP